MVGKATMGILGRLLQRERDKAMPLLFRLRRGALSRADALAEWHRAKTDWSHYTILMMVFFVGSYAADSVVTEWVLIAGGVLSILQAFKPGRLDSLFEFAWS